MKTTTWAIGVAALVCLDASPVAAQTAGASGLLADDPAFDAFVTQSGALVPLAGGREAAGYSRASIDVELVIGMLRERAAELGIRTAAGLFGDVAEEVLGRTYVTELLRIAARLLGSSAGPERDDVELLGRTLLAAGIAESLVQARFGSTGLGEPRCWAEADAVECSGFPAAESPAHAASTPDAGEVPAPGPDGMQWAPDASADLHIVRAYVVSWGYWLLSHEPLLGISSGEEPKCPCDVGAVARLCGLFEAPGSDDARRMQVASLLRWDQVSRALRMVDGLWRSVRGGSLDAREVLRAIAGGGGLGNLNTHWFPETA